jgi:hypothetical protein
MSSLSIYRLDRAHSRVKPHRSRAAATECPTVASRRPSRPQTLESTTAASSTPWAGENEGCCAPALFELSRSDTRDAAPILQGPY